MIKEIKEQRNSKDTDEMLNAIHQNYRNERDKIDWKRMDEQLRRIEEKKKEKRQNFILLFIVTIVMILLVLFQLKLESNHKERRVRECAAEGKVAVQRYTSTADIYYVCEAK